MRLVIAEKPSVAQAIAGVMGARERMEGFIAGEDVLVSWCIGHLVELACAEAYQERYAKWKFEDLPIVPSPWKYEVARDKQRQFGILRGLMNDRRITEIVCATDAGREGELIFRLVYEQAGCRKPVQRLWISSMEESAIKAGFASLQPGSRYDRLYHAALCRAQADWIVGINATRLFSVIHKKTLNVGRVMTPTLAMVVEQEAAIARFIPEPFFHVELAGDGFTASSDRFRSHEEAERVLTACEGQLVMVTDATRQDRVEWPPRLYDLTTLQRDANRLLGFSAQQTLDYAQSLYEKKWITYPRTDSRFLTSDMAEQAAEIAGVALAILPFLKGLPCTCDMRRVVDDTKISDHHALVPTSQIGTSDPTTLTAGEQEVLRLITLRLIFATGEDHRYVETQALLVCSGHTFRVKGKQVAGMGWKAVEAAYMDANRAARGKAGDDVLENEEPLMTVSLQPGMSIKVHRFALHEGKTTAPKPFTEDTLLSAMETSGAEEEPEESARRGLGTPATRAGIIEKLIRTELMTRQGGRKTKTLQPTEKGRQLIAILPETIRSPRMTAEWEHRLALIEKGEAAPDAFLQDIIDYTAKLVRSHEQEASNSVERPVNPEPVGPCPRCGTNVLEGDRRYACSNPACRFSLWKDNRFFTEKKAQLTRALLATLLNDGQAPMKNLYSTKTGRTYDAVVLLDNTGGQYVNFRLLFEETGAQKAKGR